MQRTGQLMYELSTIYPDISGILPAYGWDAPYARTADGLPYIGPHRNFPHHLFAFGDSSHSVTGAYLASRMLLRHYLGELEPADEAFGFTALMAVDLLVFGPHPDDLEIGLGGTIARHAALGLRVGLCDLTAGEMGSNGTVEERLAEAEAARSGARRGLAGEPALARSADRQGSGASREAVAFIRRHRPRVVAVPVLVGSASRSRRRERGADRSGVQRRAAALSRRRASAWKAEWICYYFINDSAPPSFVVDVSEHYDRKRAGARLPREPVPARDRAPAATRLNTPLFRQLIESRDAQFGALAGVPWAEGVVVASRSCGRRCSD